MSKACLQLLNVLPHGAGLGPTDLIQLVLLASCTDIMDLLGIVICTGQWSMDLSGVGSVGAQTLQSWSGARTRFAAAVNATVQGDSGPHWLMNPRLVVAWIK